MFNPNGFVDEYGGNGDYFTRNIFMNIGDETYEARYRAFKARFNNKDIYKCIYSFEDRVIDSCNIYGPLCIDLDGDISTDKGFEKLKKEAQMVFMALGMLGLKHDEIDLYFSGSKGFHIVVDAAVLGVEPSKDLNLLYKAWAIHFYKAYDISDMDLGIYDRRRLFRVPGSINSKTGLYKVRLTMPLLMSMNRNALLKYAGNPFNSQIVPVERKINRVAALNFYEKSKPFYNKPAPAVAKPVELPTEKQDLLPCVAKLLETSVLKGNRNNMSVMLASGLLQSGYSIDESTEVLLDWNSNNNPPMPDNEVAQTVRSAYQMIMAGRKYGCSTYKEYGFCTGICKIEGNNNNV